MDELTEEQKKILQHMLGADSRYKKKEWGFRNHYVASLGNSVLETLAMMKEKGFVRSHSTPAYGESSVCFYATEKGMKAIGFSKAQIKKAEEE